MLFSGTRPARARPRGSVWTIPILTDAASSDSAVQEFEVPGHSVLKFRMNVSGGIPGVSSRFSHQIDSDQLMGVRSLLTLPHILTPELFTSLPTPLLGPARPGGRRIRRIGVHTGIAIHSYPRILIFLMRDCNSSQHPEFRTQSAEFHFPISTKYQH